MSWVTIWLPVRLRRVVALYAPTYPYILIYLTVIWVTIGLPVLLRVVSVVLCRTIHTNSYPPIYLTVLWVTIWLPVLYRGEPIYIALYGCLYSSLRIYIPIGNAGNYLVTRETVYREVKDFRDVRFSFSVLTKHLILPKLFIITILTMYKYI